jgi:hypothetical protein
LTVTEKQFLLRFVITPLRLFSQHRPIYVVDIRDSSGDRAKRKCVQIKLTAIGTVVENVGVVNSKENVQNMSKLLQFASTQSEIERL